MEKRKLRLLWLDRTDGVEVNAVLDSIVEWALKYFRTSKTTKDMTTWMKGILFLSPTILRDFSQYLAMISLTVVEEFCL